MPTETGSETVAGLGADEIARLLRAVGMGSVTRLMPVSGGDGTDGGNGGNAGNQGDQGSGQGDGKDQSDDDAGSDDDDESLDGLKAALEKEREQRKAAQRELRALKKAGPAKTGDDATPAPTGSDKSDPARAKAEQERDAYKRSLDQLQAKLLGQAVREQARTHAEQLGALDAAAVARMVRVEDVDTDDAGEPLDVADLVKELKREHPNLFRATKGAGDGGAGNGNGGTVDPGFGLNRLRYAYEQIGKRP